MKHSQTEKVERKNENRTINRILCANNEVTLLLMFRVSDHVFATLGDVNGKLQSQPLLTRTSDHRGRFQSHCVGRKVVRLRDNS